MISRRNFFGATVGGIAGVLGYKQVAKEVEVSKEELDKGDPEFDFRVFQNGILLSSRSPHRLYNLLEKPNSYQSFTELMSNYVNQLTKNGNALIWAVPSSFGIPIELHNIPPDRDIPKGSYYNHMPYSICTILFDNKYPGYWADMDIFSVISRDLTEQLAPTFGKGLSIEVY